MEKSKESVVRIFFEMVFFLAFLTFVGAIFVALAIMLGKYELLTLVFVLLTGALIRPFISDAGLEKLENVPIIGEATEIYNQLQTYYLNSPPRNFLYYLVYPISGIIAFFFGKEKAKRELNAYFGLLQWILVVLVAEGFASYFRIYQYFDMKFAMNWFYLELLAIYFLCNFFAVPVATSTIQLGLAGKKKRLFVICLSSIMILTGFTYYFSISSEYDSLIPINITLDQRIANSAVNQQKDHFVPELKEATEMFLIHRCPEIIAFNKKHYLTTSDHARLEFFDQINFKYQQHLTSITPFGENDYFFLTTDQQYKELWGLIFLPFRESLVYIFHYKDGQLELYQDWQEIEPDRQKKLKESWDAGAFQFSKQKQLARVMVDFFRKSMRVAQKKAKMRPSDTTASKSMQEEKQISPVPDRLPRKIWPQAEKLVAEYDQETAELENARQQLFDYVTEEFSLEIKRDDPLEKFAEVWPDAWSKFSQYNFLEQCKYFSQKLPENHFLAQKVIDDMAQFKTLPPEQKINSPTRTQLERSCQKLQEWNNRIKNFHLSVQQFTADLKTFWQNAKSKKDKFVIYQKDIREFDYARALSAQLLMNHQGQSPDLEKKWYTQAYDHFFNTLMLLFQISMPLHILLILYCRRKFRGKDDDAQPDN